MHPKILKGFSLGLSFEFFEYLSFEFEYEYFENFLQNSKKIIQDKKKIYFLSVDLSISFDFFLIFKIDTQIHTQKIKIFFYLKLSFSNFARNSQNTYTQAQNSNTQKI